MAPKPEEQIFYPPVSIKQYDSTISISSSRSIRNLFGLLQASPVESVKSPVLTCEELYGPYPSSIPIPHIDKNSTTPPQIEIEEAKSMWDLQSHPDHRDVGTPDQWIPRDGRLVRLTGRHPFNVEPPVSVLALHKFITPSSVHYVRNHGAVPDLKWDAHTIDVGGSGVSNKLKLSMYDLLKFTARELPVTLVCAGNRRKEQNMIRQTIGFNWGSSGVGTNVYKGVLLRDILIRAGVDPEGDTEGMHVEFIGVEDLPNKVGVGPFPTEPWGKQVKYGTSIPLARAMNPAYDVLIAYQANGQVLQPDHGYPVRLVIPGYIGGRMIKWLSKINVIPNETKNHYHYHDNRILPPHITSEISLTKGWWYRPEYIFNELNINSTITKPDHNETIAIAKNIDNDFSISGYAYTGGGRAITRMEVSVDGGVHWEMAKMERKEKPTKYGMYWCWIWWEYVLKVSDLVGQKEIWCRAWDESHNTQPNDPTWNLMGMGNNQVFRVKIHLVKNKIGEHVFKFEHPTQPGQLKGGWMTTDVNKPDSAGFGRLLDQVEIIEDIPPPPTSSKEIKIFTREEVTQHNTEHDVWIIVNNKVFDCTEYLELHPGGADSILINAGEDSTEDFTAIHSTKATKMLDKFYIGDLDTSKDVQIDKSDKGLTDAQGNKLALDPKKKKSFPLQNKIVLSHDSFLLDFALPTPEHVLGLPTGKHIFISATINGELVMRRYTPISSNFDIGCVKFVIKAYRPHERFPNGGKMSQHLDALQIGDLLDMRGPVGEFEYLMNGTFLMDGEERNATHFNMIAGGTGITPVMQVASEILRNSNDQTRISLIFACREEGDLLMRSSLEQWEEEFPTKFKVHYILSDNWPKDWKYSTGFVGKDLFETQLYPASKTTYNLMCGPPVMIDRGCKPNLTALKHEDAQSFSF